MPHLQPCENQRLLAFNQALLVQASMLAAAFTEPARPGFSGMVGPHLRHLIEHYEALLLRKPGAWVDYDRRARDAQLEASPALAQQRLLALQQHLAAWSAERLDAALWVRGRGGLAGEFEFTVASSAGRELAFLGSHSVHHFAILKAHCLQHGIALDADFGKAPATVAYERARADAGPACLATHPQLPQTKASPCTA